MANEYKDPEVCDACGVAGDMGYIIGEGDDVAEVTISAPTAEALKARLEQYLEVAKSVNDNFKIDVPEINESTTELTAKIQFEASAEKIIFELNTRDLNSY